MIILAAAIILSLNNAGIIGNANKAVDETNVANIKSAADLAYAEYLIEPVELAENEDLGDYLTNKLVQNGTIKGKNEDYYIEMCDNETVVVKVGTTADKYYKEEIEIGDKIDYEPIEVEYTGEWYVLGIDKNNQLLITHDADDSLDDVTLTVNDYLNAPSILHQKCEKYGNGKGATGARNIEITDIFKVLGYTPQKNDAGNNLTVTYYWDGTNKPYYECSNGVTGNIDSMNSFSWFDDNGQHHTSQKSETATVENKEKICTVKIKNDGFCDKSIELLNYDETSKKYILLYGNDVGYGETLSDYFVANTGSTFLNGYLSQGVYYKDWGQFTENVFIGKFQDGPMTSCIRPVVYLDKDIVLEGNKTDGWTIVE